MKSERRGILVGILCLPVLLISTLVFSLLRPDYNHLTQSFSELGALGAPNYIWFNLVTFGLIGVMGLIFSTSLKKFWGAHMSNWLYGSHIFAQLSWILTGLFPVSFTIQWLYDVHLAFAFGTYLFGVLTITLTVKLFSTEGSFVFFNMLSVWLLFGVWASILMSESVLTPYWGQLISILSYFVWQFIYGILIYRRITQEDYPQDTR